MIVVLARFMHSLLVLVSNNDDAGRTFIKAKMQLLFYERMDRERRHLLSEFVRVKGLMPLLMKPRNQQQWTAQDKRELILDLKSVSRMSVYIVVLVMPGGFALMPVMAWWLDRRRGRRGFPQAQ